MFGKGMSSKAFLLPGWHLYKTFDFVEKEVVSWIFLPNNVLFPFHFFLFTGWKIFFRNLFFINVLQKLFIVCKIFFFNWSYFFNCMCNNRFTIKCKTNNKKILFFIYTYIKNSIFLLYIYKKEHLFYTFIFVFLNHKKFGGIVW